MEWKEYKETEEFKRLEAEAVKLDNRIYEIYREMEKSCPSPTVGREKTYYFSLAGWGKNKCVSRFHVMGHIVGND